MIDNDLEEIIIYNTLGQIDLLEDRVEIIENYNLNDIDSPTGKYNLNNQSLYNVNSISGTTLEINSDLLYLKSNLLYLTDQSSFESDIDFSKVYFNGTSHSDYCRIIDKNSLSNTLSSNLKPLTVGFNTQANSTMGLTFKAERVISGSSNQNVAIGLVTTIGNTEDIYGGSLYFSNKNGLGGIAINSKVADARLHVHSTETIKAIFSGNRAGSTGIQIVNENITGSSVLSFGNSSTLTTISAYIQKYALNAPTFSGEMVIANSNAGFSFYVSSEADILKIYSNKNANIKYNLGIGLSTNPSLISQAKLHVSSTDTMKAIFSGNNIDMSGINIVNGNNSGSTFLGFSTVNTSSDAYIKKYTLTNPSFFGEMVFINNDSGFNFYVQGEENIFKMHSNRNANYKYNFGIGINSLLTSENEARLTVRQRNKGDEAFAYGWIAGAFGGGQNNVGNMVVMGSAQNCAILAGATIDAYDWADLYVNPYSKTSFGLKETTELSAVVSIDESNGERASLNIRKGKRPNEPREGDIWIDTGDTMWIRLGGVDKIFDLI